MGNKNPPDQGEERSAKKKPHLFYPFRHLADTRCLPFSGCLRITHHSSLKI